MTTSRFENVTASVLQFLNDIRLGYVRARLADKKIEESIFAASLLSALAKHKSLFSLISKIFRSDLVDSLSTHNQKYLTILKASEVAKELMDKFEADLVIAKTALLETEINKHGLENDQEDAISQLLNNIAKRIQNIFAEQNHNEDEIDALIANTIAMQFDKIDFKERGTLAEDLFQIREVWKLSKKATYAENSKIVYFLQDAYGKIDFTEAKTVESVLHKVVDYLISGECVLIEQTDEALLILYNRVKNNDRLISFVFPLLSEIHREAKFRYSCSKLSDSCYELLSKFQKLDTILGQIDNLEIRAVEAFLIQESQFPLETIQLLKKHSDHIRALKLYTDKTLMMFLVLLEQATQRRNAANFQVFQKALTEFQNELKQALDQHVKKKYEELDHFQLAYLQKKYTAFFGNLCAVMEMADNNQKYLADVFNKKIAQDYYLPNLANNVFKIRAMEDERKSVQKLLNELNLIDIFGEMNGSKIKTIDFRNKTGKSNASGQTTEDYISSVIHVITEECSALQIEALYLPLAKKEYSSIEKKLKTSLEEQINKRISFTKMVTAILSGKMTEYNKLKELAKSI